MPEPDGEFMLDVEGDNSRSPTAALQSQCSEVRGNGARETACSENTEGVGIKDPPIPRRRGRPRNSRFKTIAETGWRCYRSASRSGSLEDNETMPQGKGKKGKAASKKSDGKGKRKAVEVEVYKPTFLFLMVLFLCRAYVLILSPFFCPRIFLMMHPECIKLMMLCLCWS